MIYCDKWEVMLNKKIDNFDLTLGYIFQVLLKEQLVSILSVFALKMMKSDFYLILKTFFVLKIFKFLSRLFGHVENMA